MKVFIYILIAVGAILIIFNATLLDFDNIFEGESAVAAISILAGLCTILLLVILKISQSISKKKKRRKN